MPVNINSVVEEIKKVGQSNVRIVPMPGSTVDGLQMIEVRSGSEWKCVAENVSRSIANDLVRQASNRVILG